MRFERPGRVAVALGLAGLVCLAGRFGFAAPSGGTPPAADSTATSGRWEIALFALTDAQGELRPCKCPGLESGGLGLRATVFKRARTLQTPALLLDGGDFAASSQDTLQGALASLFVKGMEQLSYDAVGLGERELALDRRLLADAAARIPWVCANLEGGEALGIPRGRRIERGGKKIFITAYLDPGLVPSGSPWRLLDPVTSVSAMVEPVRDEVDLVVLLAHAATDPARETLSRLSGVDVAVRGHEPEDGPPVTDVGRVPLILPAAHGVNVIQTTLSLTADGALVGRSARAWDIKQVERGDARLDALVEEFEATHGLEP